MSETNIASVEKKLVTTRVKMLLQSPWFGNLVTRMPLEITDKLPIPTAATDGKKFMFHPEFVNQCSLDELEFVFAHEILHLFYGHIARAKDFLGLNALQGNFILMNIAQDYKVNGLLVAEGIGTIPHFIQIYHDEKYRDMTSEEIYKSLLQEEKEKQSGDDSSDQSCDDDNGESDGGVPIDFGDGTKGTLKGYGKGQSTLDDHTVWEAVTEGMTEEEVKEMIEEFKEAAIAAAEVSKGAGNMPAEIARIIKELTEAKIDWRDFLEKQIQSVLKSDYSFARPSRKGWNSGIIIPGMMNGTRVELAVALDTSGSISVEQMTDFLSEVAGIVEQFEEWRIDVWCWDTEIHNHVTFDSDSDTTDDVSGYSPVGGGGTVMSCNWDFMKEQDITPNKLVIFSDMYVYGNDFGDPDYCDTIFINHGNPGFEAPHGVTVDYLKM